MNKHFSIRQFAGATLSLLVAALSSASTRAADGAQLFDTPEAAVAALSRAVNTTNRTALGALFGAASDQLVNPDEVQGATELADFAAALNATNRLVRESKSSMTLEVGAAAWPFPIPLVNGTNGWRFDTAAGLQELLNRRVGRNELAVLRVMRAYVEAQREYASRDRDGDDVLEYAQKFYSAPGLTDGLYWPTELNGEISPLGPLVAYAQGEGYAMGKMAEETGPQPFHGYLFKLLTRQGKHAPGGQYDYLINGNMIGGFALVAWPAEYGQSGVMTFSVNQQGRVYEQDLGPKTSKLARKLKEYDCGEGWQASQE